jgi:hypothetical protein
LTEDDGDWGTQRQIHDTIKASGRGALQRDKQQVTKTPSSKRDAAQDVNNNKSGKEKSLDK